MSKHRFAIGGKTKTIINNIQALDFSDSDFLTFVKDGLLRAENDNSGKTIYNKCVDFFFDRLDIFLDFEVLKNKFGDDPLKAAEFIKEFCSIVLPEGSE